MTEVVDVIEEDADMPVLTAESEIIRCVAGQQGSVRRVPRIDAPRWTLTLPLCVGWGASARLWKA